MDKHLPTLWRGDLDIFDIKTPARRVHDQCFHGWRESVTILTDRSKIFFLSVQYLEGIKWNYDICAISSGSGGAALRSRGGAAAYRAAGAVAADPGFGEGDRIPLVRPIAAWRSIERGG